MQVPDTVKRWRQSAATFTGEGGGTLFRVITLSVVGGRLMNTDVGSIWQKNPETGECGRDNYCVLQDLLKERRARDMLMLKHAAPLCAACIPFMYLTVWLEHRFANAK